MRGMLQRHDYFTDVAKGNAAHYCMDYKTFDGFVFPTRRRVVSRGESEFTATDGPSSVLIDIESVVVSRDRGKTWSSDADSIQPSVLRLQHSEPL
jgi:hypothetical protein